MKCFTALLSSIFLLCTLVSAYPSADNPSVFWRESLATSGKASFNSDTSFTVFRNVKTYGAKGDGTTDDTAAIQAALNDGSGRTFTSSTTTSPAVVYFPPGTYLITNTVQIPYYTQMLGSAIDGASSSIIVNSAWGGGWMIDADPYQNTGYLGVGSTNDFYKEIRNLNFDLSASNNGGAALHWPTAQACHLQDITITMSTDPSTQQTGIFIESGSGGFMSDIVFNGGDIGLSIGNQQFESRALTFNNCRTAISQIWNWNWLYQGLVINNCGIGIDMTSGGSGAQNIGSITVLDSLFINTPIGISTVTTSTSSPATAGSLLIDNTQFSNSPTAVQGANGAVLLDAGPSMRVQSWAQGHFYSGTSKTFSFVQGNIAPPVKDSALLSGGNFVAKSRPSYATYSSDKFISVKAAGATADGATDDTATLQSIFNNYCATRIIFFDAGTYIITSTLTLPAGCWVVGEGESVLMAKGSNFANPASPTVVLKIGNPGDTATTQVSGLMLSNQGGVPGAIMIEWNIVDSSGNSGIWTTHIRHGGARGTSQETNCPTTYSSANVQSCSGSFLMFHMKGSGYFENMWLWTADHLLDDPSQAQINIYTGRGLLIESTGASFFSAVASEHCTLYMYQINTQSPLFMGLLQSETPYFQPTPAAPGPYVVNTAYNDPSFSASRQSALSLRVLNSPSVLLYGGGFYSFFSSYTQSCISARTCQTEIVSFENSTPYIYNLNTIGTTYMLNINGEPIISGADNLNVYPDNVVAYLPLGLSVVSQSMSSTMFTSTTTSSSMAMSTTTSTSSSSSMMRLSTTTRSSTTLPNSSSRSTTTLPSSSLRFTTTLPNSSSSSSTAAGRPGFHIVSSSVTPSASTTSVTLSTSTKSVTPSTSTKSVAPSTSTSSILPSTHSVMSSSTKPTTTTTTTTTPAPGRPGFTVVKTTSSAAAAATTAGTRPGFRIP